MAEAVVKPEITEWLMKRRSHPSLKVQRIDCKNYKRHKENHRTYLSK
jgi:hypothetical protein